MKKILTKLALAFTCLALNSTLSVAQSIGSYDTTITFLSSPRAVSMYVPTTYTPTTAYNLMICLHGLGDTCRDYRNALTGSLGWNTAMPNTIFICPEAATRNSDYFFPAGNEAIIQACIDFTKNTYNIDTNEIVLQGFSLGGRAALRYALNNPNKFKGLLLNTPAIQGVKQAINGTDYPFTYTNAPQIPTYITFGETDVIYTGAIDTTYLQLVRNNGVVRYKKFPSLGHTIPPYTGMNDFLSFFNTPSHPGLDVDVVTAMSTPRSCATSITPSCIIRNTGTTTITAANLSYNAGAGASSYTWSGSLAPFEHAVVALPAITTTSGNITLSVTATTLNGSIADTVTSNNSALRPVVIQPTALTLPYTEGFDGTTYPPANWVAMPAGDVHAQWDRDSDVKRTGAASIYAFNTILIFDNSSRTDEIASPVFNLSGSSNPYLSFDVSYNYHKYTPPYLTVDSSFADTLSIMASTDCGATYTTIYKKGGAELASFAQPILNPLSIPACFTDPADSNWRTENISLSSFTTATSTLFKFSYKSALGGCINIDNMRVGEGPVKVQNTISAKATIYPNPASNHLFISTPSPLTSITITDMSGRMVSSEEQLNKTNHTLDVSTLSSGLYLLHCTLQDGSSLTEKISVTH